MRDKREKFLELAEKRVKRVLQDLRLVGNLANRSNYTYSNADFDLIVNAIDAEVKRLKARVKAHNDSSDSEFKMKR